MLDVERLVGDDAQSAEEAFSRLSGPLRNFLRRYLRDRVYSSEDREDVVIKVLENIWASRRGFVTQGPAAWWRYVKRIADRCTIDYFRAQERAVPVEDVEEWSLAEEDLPYIDAIASAMARESMYELANECWIGHVDPTRLLAAQLYFLEGMRWQEILQMLSPLTRDELESALSNEEVLRALAYSEFYQGNDALCSHLLGVQADRLDATGEALGRAEEAEPVGDWTAAEARVILWRFRNGLLMDQIARFRTCRLERAALEALIARCVARFTFGEKARRLRLAVGRRASAFNHTGLWRRLVFQYHCADELPQKQIMERTAPCAVECGAKLTEGMLNVWLSNGRLFSQLAAYAQERHAA